MAVGQIVAGAKQLGVRQISSALDGVLALQARGDDFSIRHSSRVLRALWPSVVSKLPHFGPGELAAALQSYWWQLSYSRQELSLSGVAREHPVVEMTVEASGSGRTARSPLKEQQATDDLRTRLLRPVLQRLGEMGLRQVGSCLTAIAPSVRPPDVLDEEDRAFVRAQVERAFLVDENPEGCGQAPGDFAAWRSDFWLGEVQSLDTAELLELACGIRESGAGPQWVESSLFDELQQRLRPAGRAQPSVELSHLLLLRLCRVMDIWQGHEVEGVLRQLLSSPEAVRPLPTSYFVAVLEALCAFSVPKELPLRLLAAFLDRVERGERSVQPEQWAELLCAIRPLDEQPSWERVVPRILQSLVPHVSGLPAPALAELLRSLASKPYPAEPARGGYSALERAPGVVTAAVREAVEAGRWGLAEAVGVFDSLGQLNWYDERAAAAILAQCARTPLLEPHVPLMLPLARASAALRVHHAPLLHKMVLWYCWCYTYLRPKPLPTEQLDELLEFAGHLLELSFQSLELHSVLAENLRNPQASPRQVLALLATLARFSHFPPEFKETCARVCAESSNTDLASLSPTDLVNAFNIHLCAVFDGPAALKHWLTEDAAMKAFFQVHTSQKWYQRQDQERTSFLQSPAYLTLKQAAEEEGLHLQPSDPGEVYHVELVSRDAKQRLSAWSNDPPVAVVCIKTREQLRWYVPITADGGAEPEQLDNRCHQFRYMFRGAVQKMRHLSAMGYRPAVVWMSEWNALETQQQRSEYLRTALGAPGRRSTAFSPAGVEVEDAYR
uniref:RAP domain-containing protein n=1 Tax=Alexandrium catenella TaxID=2925 RepID=A0A7S1L8G7_ALECA